MSPRWLCGLCVLLVSSSLAVAQDPLRFVPSNAEVVVKVDRPREVLEAVEKNELFQQAQKLAGIREYYDSTNFQQLYQLIAYFEKELGKNRNEIVNDLSAGGVVLAARLTEPKWAVLILQSKDEPSLRRVMDLALDIVEKELERQDSKDRVVRKQKYERYEIGQIDRKFVFALADGALLMATDEKALKMALDASLGKNDQKNILTVENFTAARKSAPKKALAWSWLHLDEIRKEQKFKDGVEAASLDPFQVLLFGGLTNLVKRSPYLTASLLRESETLHRVRIQMPRGRDGMPALSHMILPADENGTLPLLLPPRVVSTSSYFLDLGQYWDQRVGILGEKNAKGLEEGDKNLGKFLGGIKLEKLFHAAGPHHRLVFAQQKETPYKVRSGAPFPAVALVVSNARSVVRQGHERHSAGGRLAGHVQGRPQSEGRDLQGLRDGFLLFQREEKGRGRRAGPSLQLHAYLRCLRRPIHHERHGRAGPRPDRCVESRAEGEAEQGVDAN